MTLEYNDFPLEKSETEKFDKFSGKIFLFIKGYLSSTNFYIKDIPLKDFIINDSYLYNKKYNQANSQKEINKQKDPLYNSKIKRSPRHKYNFDYQSNSKTKNFIEACDKEINNSYRYYSKELNKENNFNTQKKIYKDSNSKFSYNYYDDNYFLTNSKNFATSEKKTKKNNFDRNHSFNYEGEISNFNNFNKKEEKVYEKKLINKRDNTVSLMKKFEHYKVSDYEEYEKKFFSKSSKDINKDNDIDNKLFLKTEQSEKNVNKSIQILKEEVEQEIKTNKNVNKEKDNEIEDENDDENDEENKNEEKNDTNIQEKIIKNPEKLTKSKLFIPLPTKNPVNLNKNLLEIVKINEKEIEDNYEKLIKIKEKINKIKQLDNKNIDISTKRSESSKYKMTNSLYSNSLKGKSVLKIKDLNEKDLYVRSKEKNNKKIEKNNNKDYDNNQNINKLLREIKIDNILQKTKNIFDKKNPLDPNIISKLKKSNPTNISINSNSNNDIVSKEKIIKEEQNKFSINFVNNNEDINSNISPINKIQKENSSTIIINNNININAYYENNNNERNKSNNKNNFSKEKYERQNIEIINYEKEEKNPSENIIRNNSEVQKKARNISHNNEKKEFSTDRNDYKNKLLLSYENSEKNLNFPIMNNNNKKEEIYRKRKLNKNFDDNNYYNKDKDFEQYKYQENPNRYSKGIYDDYNLNKEANFVYKKYDRLRADYESLNEFNEENLYSTNKNNSNKYISRY